LVVAVVLVTTMDQEILLEVVVLEEEHLEVLNHLLEEVVVGVVTVAALLDQELPAKVTMAVLVYGLGIQVAVEVLGNQAVPTQQKEEMEYQVAY
jgi:hypothetical protein